MNIYDSVYSSKFITHWFWEFCLEPKTHIGQPWDFGEEEFEPEDEPEENDYIWAVGCGMQIGGGNLRSSIESKQSYALHLCIALQYCINVLHCMQL